MNYNEKSILRLLIQNPLISQRQIAKELGYSLGLVNKSMKVLQDEGYIDHRMKADSMKLREFRTEKPERAVILAAGFGMRMVPIGSDIPKALLEVKGEVLVERIIRQLKDKGVEEIYVVVGYLKEMFEYLTDALGVKLIINSDYAVKNNLHSLSLFPENFEKTYIIPGDVYAVNNPFHEEEFSSWYMIGAEKKKGTHIKLRRDGKIEKSNDSAKDNRVLGISYVSEVDGIALRKQVDKYAQSGKYDGAFWEEALLGLSDKKFDALVVKDSDVIEINTYEELRELDEDSAHLNSETLHQICEVFHCDLSEINEISVLKKGMTNRSFLFSAKGEKYIMRVPGEGTSELINREEEGEVYKAIQGIHISDEVVFFSPEKGYKITKFMEDARECDPMNQEDVKRCMDVLRSFHDQKLEVSHNFDLFGMIRYYESLWKSPTLYKDYIETKKRVESLQGFIERVRLEYQLCHIDAVPDNFLFSHGEIRLIDWEYAGMQDPHVDIAMFAIYSLYDKAKIDRLIDTYFEGMCDEIVRIKIYAYIAICGLLWSNWCEYKRMLGVEFGEYSIIQYQYAKEYSHLVKMMLNERFNENDDK
ncbi:winged helix-turn-helix transcriptional regulator [Proteiniclasticum ruminis]|uniref:CTP:phosphocholine cytidylyltransferase n=1 Tax=Proteiniclasticum ruminis TaxID=398199 RepID=A0A1I5A508_9CLOT|nr:winged helix-turn-helix transcriptional regulator [Proteiniclasticum ruminis]SFN57496.1 CTP:phosphocholine cytidylyltransferase [Proteiniclasticum ruminis]